MKTLTVIIAISLAGSLQAQLAGEAEGRLKIFGPFYDPGPGRWKNLGTIYVGGSSTVNLGITTINAKLAAGSGADVTITGTVTTEVQFPELFKVSAEFTGSETVSEHLDTEVTVPIPPCGWGKTRIDKTGRQQRCYFQVYSKYDWWEPSRTRVEWQYVTVVTSGKLKDPSKCQKAEAQEGALWEIPITWLSDPK